MPANAPTRTITLDDMTPEELAQLFAPMGSDEQARFFDALAVITGDWRGLGWCGQCAYMVDNLSTAGAEVVLTLAGHIEAHRDSRSKPEGPRLCEDTGSVHESGGAEGNRPKTVRTTP